MECNERQPDSSLPSAQSGVPSQRRCGGKHRAVSAQRSPSRPAAVQCAHLRSSSASAQSGMPSHDRRDSASRWSPALQPESK